MKLLDPPEKDYPEGFIKIFGHTFHFEGYMDCRRITEVGGSDEYGNQEILQYDELNFNLTELWAEDELVTDKKLIKVIQDLINAEL